MYWNITFWYSFFQCHYFYSLLFNSGFIKRNRDPINDTDIVKISPYIAVKLVKVSVHGCCLCYISGQICYRLVSSAMGKENWHGQNMNKLKSLKTTRTYERKPALASVFHHFQFLREKLVLFTVGLHVHLTKDLGKLTKEIGQRLEVAGVMLLHTNTVCKKTNNYPAPTVRGGKCGCCFTYIFHISQTLISLIASIFLEESAGNRIPAFLKCPSIKSHSVTHRFDIHSHLS